MTVRRGRSNQTTVSARVHTVPSATTVRWLPSITHLSPWVMASTAATKVSGSMGSQASSCTYGAPSAAAMRSPRWVLPVPALPTTETRLTATIMEDCAAARAPRTERSTRLFDGQTSEVRHAPFGTGSLERTSAIGRQTETYDRNDANLAGSEGDVTETSDVHGQGAHQESERTVTVTGIPLLLTGLAALLGFRWIRRRSRRPESSAS